MVDIKISLNIELPGNTMYSKEASFKNATPIPDRHNKEFLKVEDGKGNFETLAINTRKCIPAKQVINLSQEAYDYFISDDKPAEYRGDWKKMSQAARLHWHMEETAKALGGRMIDFTVLD